MNYLHAAVGGTFDRLHAGHIELLTTAFANANQVTIGLTSDAYVSNKILAQLIESYEQRHYSLITWLTLQSIHSDRYKIVKIEDIYGPTIIDTTLDLLVVSPQTLVNADKVNKKRIAHQLQPLSLLTTQMIHDAHHDYLSSTNIRSGISSREGNRFDQIFYHDYHLSPRILSLLHVPYGEQIIDPKSLSSRYLAQFTAVWLVGDVITDFFVAHKFIFDRAIIDGRTERGPYQSSIVNRQSSIVANNPPHTITSTAANAVYTASKGEIININGEEDLLALVGILTAPLNSAIFYGRPKLGIGMIQVTEQLKNYYFQLINNKS